MLFWNDLECQATYLIGPNDCALPEDVTSPPPPSLMQARLVHMWEDYGQPKVVLKVDSEEDLLQLMQKALSVGLNASIVRDAGRTQIAAGSKTVLAIGPGG